MELETKPCLDESLIMRADQVVRRLRTSHCTVIMAESCTAGLVAAVLAQGEGASDILHGSFVTYTKANKAAALGVDLELLKRRGAVNEDVVRQLVSGALDRSPANLAVAITGVLGPEPDEDGNPVGLVYYGYCRRGGRPRIVRKDYGKRHHDELLRITVMDALALIESGASRDGTGRNGTA